MPSRDFTNEDLFSSPTMSMHNSTHSSQMNTVGPAMSLRTSCGFSRKNEEQCFFWFPPPPPSPTPNPQKKKNHPSRTPAPQPSPTHDREGQPGAGGKGGGPPASSIIEEASENP